MGKLTMWKDDEPEIKASVDLGEDPYDSWDLNQPLPLEEMLNNIGEAIRKAGLYIFMDHKEFYTPDHILRSGNRTIVFWQDGTKTIVKRSSHDCPDDYMAFTAALAIKIFDSNSALKRMLKDKTYVQVKMANGKCKTTKKSDLYAPLEGYES